ncbi:HAD family hydrolase [Leptospira wolffii]|uniref:HAD family hydrolase n=1 Tax=Leptospira wolffii TaxID=409998 RepID=UPI0003141EDD|nr:HAD-IB family phosphatase [Leptospira wolffii]EPG67179.1 HAD phosphoserine phosphatase-like hydrolase, family IB [Leptospira wolffii serovar Khorat str. Khorat-H2]
MLPSSDWSPEVFSFLEEYLTGRRDRSVVFDFDNTLVREDFGEAVMCELLFEGVPWVSDLSPFFPEPGKAEQMESLRRSDTKEFLAEIWKYYGSKIEKGGLEAGYRWSTWIFSGRPASELSKTASIVWKRQQESDSMESVQAYKPMFELVSELRRIGADIKIITASPDLVIQEVSELWGISKENVLGMRLKESGGVLIPELKEPFTYGIGKVKLFREASGQDRFELAFGDSENDFPMLEEASIRGIFLDRGKKKIPPQGTLIQKVSDWKTVPIILG